ncbi:MAG: acetyl esterase/lipase [Candidatus Azotimanducaceae bacterium]|jgi:acetyl esterase/lipase
MADVSFNEVASFPYKAPTKSISYGPDPLQTAEYWGVEPTAPLILLIHGGCWLNAYDKDHIRPLATALAERGLAVLSVEYRRIGDTGGGWPGTFDDLDAVLEAALKLNHPAIIAAGHSAGGHLALWLGARPASPLKGVVGLAAISDLVLYAKGTSRCEKATLELMGGTPESYPDRYQAASPLLMTSELPTLLIHGSEDQIVNIQQSNQMFKQLSKPSSKPSPKGQPNVRLHVLEGHGHFDMVDPRQEVPDIIVEQVRVWLK